jgi:hypothetical protein
MPLIKNNGMRTAMSEIEIDRIVKPISPPLQGSLHRRLPFLDVPDDFLDQEIASSTTKPTAIVSAISDRLSRHIHHRIGTDIAHGRWSAAAEAEAERNHWRGVIAMVDEAGSLFWSGWTMPQ